MTEQTEAPALREFRDDKGTERRYGVVGENGAVTIKVYFTDNPIRPGKPFFDAVSLHYNPGRAEGAQLPGPCDVLPGGTCVGDGSYSAGRVLEEMWRDDRDDRFIYSELRDWYHSYMGR